MDNPSRESSEVEIVARPDMKKVTRFRRSQRISISSHKDKAEELFLMPCPSAISGLHLREAAIHEPFRSRDVTDELTFRPCSDRVHRPRTQLPAAPRLQRAAGLGRARWNCKRYYLA
jgi:hypothetical protein